MFLRDSSRLRHMQAHSAGVLGKEVHMLQESERLLTRREAVVFLNRHGFPISLSTIAKMSMPSRGEGPRAEGRWGGRDLYRPDRLLLWARARLRNVPSCDQ